MSVQNIKRPLNESYWVVPGKFLAGEFPGDFDKRYARAKINSLIEAGITSFIDLTEKDEGLSPYFPELEDQTYERFPIKDGSIPDSPKKTVEILDAIDSRISQGKTVYLHCWGGVGRTGLIVGCWLSRHGHKGVSALERLHELWQQRSKSDRLETPETDEQERYILNWNEID